MSIQNTMTDGIRFISQRNQLYFKCMSLKKCSDRAFTSLVEYYVSESV